MRAPIPIAVAALAAVLVGCTSAPSEDEVSTSPASTPSETATASPTPTPSAQESPQLDRDQLAAIFTSVQFRPGAYGTTSELIDSIYPGLSSSDPTCLAPFGADWETLAEGATLEFGASNDRTLTAVAASTADATDAAEVLAEVSSTIDACAASGATFTVQGSPVQVQVERVEPSIGAADDSLGWRATGALGGSSFSIVGSAALVDSTVVAVVGWSAPSNETNTPLATQYLVDGLAGS